MLRIARHTENQLREFLRVNFNTTLPRFDVAAALYRTGAPMKMSELSQMLLVSNGNATTVVDRLEREGKVERIADASDKRVVLVDLTEAGRAWFEELAKAHEAEVDRLFARLGHSELDRLRDLIHVFEGVEADMEKTKAAS